MQPFYTLRPGLRRAEVGDHCGRRLGRMGVLRIVVADDHKLMIDALRLVLVPDEGMELVGATTDGRKLLPLVANTRPDVVLLDVRMPDMDGLKCLAQLRDRYPEIKVVMLSGNDDPALIQEALRGGARAFVLKQIDPAELPAA